MGAFLVLAVLMSAMALALVVPVLLKGAPSRSAVSRRAANAAIHNAELDRLDRQLSAGRITDEAHREARDEVMRRVLGEGASDTTLAAPAPARAPAAAVAVAVPLVAIALYLLVGNPGALGHLSVPAQLDASSVTADKLEEHLRYAPRDGRAWVLLARLEMDAGRYETAVGAYEHALSSNAKIARDAGIWCELADAVGMAQGGTLRGRPRELIEKALVLSPGHPRALEMAGSAAYEAGRYAETLDHWSALLAQIAPGSAAHEELGVAIARVRARAPAASAIH
jgi:cytochrome c-type biogenesis protein CcmH